MENLNELIEEAIRKATHERGHVNILIAGRTGIGKSTLINSVFQSNLAQTGHGKPVTQNTREISKRDVPLTIFDTRGLEMADFKETNLQLENFIEDRRMDRDSDRHIHLAWLCIQEDTRRVEDAEIELHKMLSNHVPLMTIITKARSDNGFKQEVQRLLPKSRNVIRVRAISETLDEGIELGPMGLEDLIDLSSEIIPEGKQRALAAAQKASIDFKKSQAKQIVYLSASSAAVAGASPIPFSDAAVLAPIQIGMIAKITSVFGVEISRGALATIVSSAIGVTGAVFTGRAIVANVLKFVPGYGTVAGGAISATTASALTVFLGMSYISVLAGFFTENPESKPDPETIGKRLKEEMRKK